VNDNWVEKNGRLKLELELEIEFGTIGMVVL
jgi:hypothetical protein